MIDDKVVQFPKEETSPKDQVRRQIAEAQRLANLAPGEFLLWAPDSAKRLGIPVERLITAVKTILRKREKEADQAKAEERRRERRVERKREQEQKRTEREATRKSKEKAKAFESLIELPSKQHETGLVDLAISLGEELDSLRDEFTDFIDSKEMARDAERVAPWDEPVDTKVLLSEVEAQIRRYVVMSDDVATAATLWTMFSWTHDVAIHSPILIVTSAERDSGKTTLLGVLGFLVPRPYHVVEATGASVYRLVDHATPTLLVDEADRLFQRKNDVAHIINAGWTRGQTIPRLVGKSVYQFDLFCPKAIGLIGLAFPPATVSRGIVVKLWPKLPDEKIENFNFVDDDDFAKLRRKLLRWSNDIKDALKDAHPLLPAGFNNRVAANWKPLLAIADFAGAGQRVRQVAIRLSQKRLPIKSEGRRLLESLHTIFTDIEMITSAEAVTRLTADRTGEWIDFRGRGPITQRQLAAVPSDYEIFPVVLHPTRRSGLSRRGYRRTQFTDAFARFLPSDPNIRTLERKRRLK
jgi:Protein of unknown function (DUF3631)